MKGFKLPKMPELVVMVVICGLVALAVVWSSKNVDFVENLTDKKGWF